MVSRRKTISAFGPSLLKACSSRVNVQVVVGGMAWCMHTKGIKEKICVNFPLSPKTKVHPQSVRSSVLICGHTRPNQSVHRGRKHMPVRGNHDNACAEMHVSKLKAKQSKAKPKATKQVHLQVLLPESGIKGDSRHVIESVSDSSSHDTPPP